MKKLSILVCLVTVNLALFSQESKTVEILAGGLYNALTEIERNTVTDLTVTGTMNSNDFYTMRNNMPLLENVNLQEATINNNIVPGSAFENKSSLKSIKMPKTATLIEAWAFYNCINLTEIQFPDSLTRIGYAGFRACKAYEGPLYLPQKLNQLDACSFYDCNALDSIVLPESLVRIEYEAFRFCYNLKGKLIIPALVNYIGSNAFSSTLYTSAKINNSIPADLNGSSFGETSVFFVPLGSKEAYRTNTEWNGNIIIEGDVPVAVNVNVTTPGMLGELILQSVEYLKDVNLLKIEGVLNNDDIALLKNNLPDLVELDMSKSTVSSLPNSQFENRQKIQKIVLPDSLTTIGNYCFRYCYDLIEIEIPKKVTEITYAAFENCQKLEKLVLPPNLIHIDDYAFGNCYALKQVNLPESTKTIDYYAFIDCNTLTSLIIPNGITTIESGCFHHCSNLKSIQLSENLTEIKSDAFSYCAIDSIVFPSSTNTIGTNAFYNNPTIQYIKCQQPTPPILPNDIFYYADKTKVELIVPFWSVNMYKQANTWSGFATINTFSEELKNIPIKGALVLANNTRPTGFPNVKIIQPGSLTVGGNAPFPTDNFSMYHNLNQAYYYSNTRNEYFSSFINESPAMTANKVVNEFSMYASRWYFMVLPYDLKVSDISASNTALFAVRNYNGAKRAEIGTGQSWVTMTSDSILKAGVGFIINSNENTDLSFPAPDSAKNKIFASDAQFLTLHNYPSEINAHKNWNFTGNPYPCFYDSRYLNFTAPITVWNPANSTYTAISLTDDKYALKPFEGFFAQKPDDITELSFVPEGRQNTAILSESGPNALPKSFAPQLNPRRVINLYLNADEYSDKTRVVINSQASLNYELKYDASKFFSTDLLNPQIYSMDGEGNACAINERPIGEGIIPIAYKTGTQSHLTLKLESQYPVEDEQIILIDKLANTQTTLSDNPYTFSSNAGTFEDRFVLKVIATITQREEIDDIPTVVAGGKGKIWIQTKLGQKINIINLNGICVFEGTSLENTNEVKLTSGIYIVKIGNETFKSVVL